jgi:hypothetical protein
MPGASIGRTLWWFVAKHRELVREGQRTCHDAVRAQRPQWVNRVILRVRRSLPVYPTNRHFKSWSACLKGATSGLAHRSNSLGHVGSGRSNPEKDFVAVTPSRGSEAVTWKKEPPRPRTHRYSGRIPPNGRQTATFQCGVTSAAPGGSGSPALRRPSSNIARSSGRRNGMVMRSEILGAGMSCRRRATAFCASSRRPASALLAAATPNPRGRFGRLRAAFCAHRDASTKRPAQSSARAAAVCMWA